MGKNTPQRQEFIIENLRVEKDASEDESSDESEDTFQVESQKEIA